MAIETLSDDTTLTLTLTQDELWQVRGGNARVMTAAPSAVDDGIEMTHGDVIPFASGDVVRVWSPEASAARTVKVIRMPRSV